MKKIISLTAISLFLASSSFAATLTLSMDSTGKSAYGAKTGVTITPGSAGTVLLGKTSTGVGIGANSEATGYSLQTQHKNGTKSYGTSYDSTAIYVKSITKGTADTTGTSNPDSTGLLTSGWTTM